jgi:hypothetical protein
LDTNIWLIQGAPSSFSISGWRMKITKFLE